MPGFGIDPAPCIVCLMRGRRLVSAVLLGEMADTSFFNPAELAILAFCFFHLDGVLAALLPLRF